MSKKNKGTADGWQILQDTLLANPTLKRKVLNRMKEIKKKFEDDRRKFAASKTKQE